MLGNVKAEYSSVEVSATVRAGICGDGIVEVGQQCEAGELLGKTCRNFGFQKGELKCSNICKFDTSECFNIPLFSVNVKETYPVSPVFHLVWDLSPQMHFQ